MRAALGRIGLYYAVGGAAGCEIGYSMRYGVGAFHVHVVAGVGDGEAVEVGDVRRGLR